MALGSLLAIIIDVHGHHLLYLSYLVANIEEAMSTSHPMSIKSYESVRLNINV